MRWRRRQQITRISCCCCTHYLSLSLETQHSTPKWAMKVNDSGVLDISMLSSIVKDRKRSNCCDATQYTAGPKVHLIDSSRLTVNNDNWLDTGVLRSIVDSCEGMHEHAMAASKHTEIMLLYALLKLVVGSTALNAKMSERGKWMITESLDILML